MKDSKHRYWYYFILTNVYLAGALITEKIDIRNSILMLILAFVFFMFSMIIYKYGDYEIVKKRVR